MSIDLEQFHQVFFEESFEGLDIMESGLMGLDLGEADSEEINTIFRAAHSIKGGSGTFGFMHISDFTHVMETLLDEMRDGRRQVSQDAVDVLLNSVDVLNMMLSAAREKTDIDDQQVATQKSALDALLSGEAVADTPAPAAVVAAVPDTPPATQLEAAQDEEVPCGWKIVFSPHRTMMQTGNDPVRIIRELAELGELDVTIDTDHVPMLADMNPVECYLSWNLKLRGDIDQQELDDIFAWIEDECDMAIMPLFDEPTTQAQAPAAPVAPVSVDTMETGSENRKAGADLGQTRAKPREKTPAAKKGAAKPAASNASSSIRVDIGKIDSLINMVGELVITQSMLSMMGENFELERLEKLQDGLGQLERHTRNLQESVMQVRMLPISFTFSRFPRMVRDISKTLGKSIELKLSGENTEVDKTVIEKIGDPLVHLVRNSVDHGIEMPDVRAAAGKPETGTVHLSAFHQGGSIVIEISDDGGGINSDVIFNKAVEKGLIDADDHLSDSQIYDLLFMPGFSTAAEITDVSGRGVGMDVVRKNILSLGGSIHTVSELGVGSTFTIKLPLTLAILDGQIVTVGDEVYIVPLISIIESIQVSTDQINRVAGKGETFKLRDEYLPIVRLSRIFNISEAKAEALNEGLLVVIESGDHKFGLFVDDLLGQQQVVIKSLEANYQKVPGVSGATILGDGSVALILDISSLVRMVNIH